MLIFAFQAPSKAHTLEQCISALLLLPSTSKLPEKMAAAKMLNKYYSRYADISNHT